MLIGYKLATEGFGPKELIRQGGVQAGGGGADSDCLPGTDFSGQYSEAAGADEPAEPGDGFFMRGGGIEVRDGDGGAERHGGEAVFSELTIRPGLSV